MKMKKLILATLMGWAVLTLVASVLVTGTSDPAPTTSTIPYAQKGQCGVQSYQTEAQEWRPKPQTPTATPDVSVRHDQGKESIRVPMLVGDKITVVEMP
jgi:hypothetical protein